MSVCKPLGLIDDLTRFFLPSNRRRSRVSSAATMTAVSTYKPVSVDSTATPVTKQKPKQRWHKHILRGSKTHKHLSPAVRVSKKLKQKVLRKPISGGVKVMKSQQHRRRQHRDHVGSLIDGLTDYFAAHNERRLKSPALKSMASYGLGGDQAMSSHQLDSPTDTSKQLLPSLYASDLSHQQPRKQKKATVEKLFDGLSSFFSVQSEHRRQPTSPTSPIPPGSQETGVRNEATSVDGRTGVASNEIKFSQLMNVPLKDTDGRLAAAKTSHLKGLFDGLSHLYTAQGDRKRKSPFFYTAQPTKSRAAANQRPASPVKPELVGTGPDVADTSTASQMVKVTKEKQQRTPGKLSINKSQLPKKSLKPISPAIKKQPSSSGMLL